MVLNTKDFDIKIFYYRNYFNIQNVEEVKKVFPFESKIFNCIVNDTYGWGVGAGDADFMYLGTQGQFLEELESRKYGSNFSDLKKVNFAENATFPRVKLSMKGIKRCNDINNADALVCDRIFIESQAEESYTKISENGDKVILFSPSKKQYFIFNCYLKNTGTNNRNNNFCKTVKMFGDYTIDTFESFIDFLKDIDLLPEDCVEFYRGQIIFFRGAKTCNTLIKIFSNDVKLIESKDLDEYCSEELSELDLAGFESIKTMILSADRDTASLGLKLLCSSNVKNIKNSIIFFIQKRFGTVKDNNYFSSSNFMSFLNKLGIQYNRYGCRWVSVSDLYKTAVGEDKEYILSEIYKEIDKAKSKFINGILSNYDFLDINVDIKLKDE